MSSKFQISNKLKNFGYQLVKETSGYDRFIGAAAKSSLYVKDDYISATGAFAVVERDIPRTSSDPKGNPEWKGQAVYAALNSLEKLNSEKQQQSQQLPTEISEELPKSVSGCATESVEILNDHFNWNSTGIYIAYPTSQVLKPIYRGYTTKVNNEHTKVGIAKDSFASRKNSYVSTFDGEVVFLPVAEVSVELLESVEQNILNRLSPHFNKVGHSREWFNTGDRKTFLSIINEVVG